jgi:hypothetical protein
MAVMFPAYMPEEILEDERRAAECLVYEELQRQLDDDFHVFYSSPWLGTRPDGSEVEGEADFVVAHPNLGVLCIEVKGGGITIDSDGQWRSRDRHGITYKIKNPVKQARDSKHALRRKLKESPRWGAGRWVTDRHGVILPGVRRDARALRPDMPLDLFAFNEDLQSLRSWVHARFNRPDPDDVVVSGGPGRDGIAAIDDLIARPIRLQITLSANVGSDLRRIETLTNRQYHIIRSLARNRRMAIAGAAGTGKTILALHKAALLAGEGQRVLFLCFNRPLSLFLKERLNDFEIVTTKTFHAFYNETMRAADRTDQMLSGRATPIADRLVDAFVESGLDEYDAVIVDEGQDFEDDWLEALEVVVRDARDGILYIFFDDNQNVMSRGRKYIEGLGYSPYDLTQNFRNTRRIFQLANQYYRGSLVEPIGPEGLPVLWHDYSDIADLKKGLAKRIGDLVHNQNILPAQIAILVPDVPWISKLAPSGRISVYEVSDAETITGVRVVVDSVRRFKGLERPVVLLVLDAQASTEIDLLYTAITRAQTLLNVFAPPHLAKRLQNP